MIGHPRFRFCSKDSDNPDAGAGHGVPRGKRFGRTGHVCRLFDASIEFGQEQNSHFRPVTPARAEQAHGVLQFAVQSLESIVPAPPTSSGSGDSRLAYTVYKQDSQGAERLAPARVSEYKHHATSGASGQPRQWSGRRSTHLAAETRSRQLDVNMNQTAPLIALDRPESRLRALNQVIHALPGLVYFASSRGG